MAIALAASMLAALLLAGMLACLWAGRRLGRSDPAAVAESGTLDAAVLGLFGLLLAFTFSGAGARFDGRRALVSREANAIGTAWLQLDLLPPAAQPELRALFRRYVEARLATHAGNPAGEVSPAASAAAGAIQAEIWSRGTVAARATENPAVLSLVAGALNEMFDVASARIATSRNHPPLAVFILLFGAGLAAAYLGGLSSARSDRFQWVPALVFAVVVSAAVYVILDLEFPRAGLIRVDAVDRLLVDLLGAMR